MRNSIATLGATMSTLLAVCACNNDKPSGSATSTLSELEAPIVDCQTQQATCLFQARTPEDAFSCNDEMGKCLLDRTQQLADVTRSVAECQNKARECVVQNGPIGVEKCRTDFNACVGSAIDADGGVPTPPGLPGLPGGGGTASPFPARPGLPGAGGFAGAPSFPRPGNGFGGAGSLPGGRLPGRDLPGVECLRSLRECVISGKAPTDCASEARACLAGGGEGGAGGEEAGAGDSAAAGNAGSSAGTAAPAGGTAAPAAGAPAP